MLDKLNQREKKLLKILIFVLIFLLFYLLGYKLLWKKYSALTERLQQERKELTILSKASNKLSSVKKQFSATQARLEEVRRQIALDVTGGETWFRIGKYIKENGIELVWIQPQNIEKKDYYVMLTFDLKIKGEYNRIINFFNYLRELPGIWQVNNFTISIPDSHSDVVADININVYGRNLGGKNLSLEQFETEIVNNLHKNNNDTPQKIEEKDNSKGTNKFIQRGKYSFPIRREE